MVTAVILAALLAPAAAVAKSAQRPSPAVQEAARSAAVQVPLPQPRPADAPARDAAEGAASDKGTAPDKPAAPGKSEAAAPAALPVSACRLALTDEIAVAPSIPAIHGPGGCGGDDLVRLEAVVLPDKRKVALTPAATMRCPMATAIANWVRSDIVPLESGLGSPLVALDNFDSYECRGRNGKAGAPLSEHGRANALDVHGFKLADGRLIDLTDRTQPRELRETVLHSVCTRFSTVLGPDSDWYHEDHIHLDLMERRNNYKICQWDVLDPMPKVAPLLPAMRPEEAPPRETADAGDGTKKAEGDAKGKATEPAAVEEDRRPAAVSDSAGEAGRTVPQVSAPKIAPRDVPLSGATAARGRSSGITPPAARPTVPQSADTSVAAVPSSKPPASNAPSGKASTDKGAVGGASADSTAANANKRATKKRQRVHRGWNPFGPFF